MSQATARVTPKHGKQKPTLTPRQAAELLGVCEATLYRLVNEGRLPHVRTGGPGSRIIIGRARLLEWVNSGGLAVPTPSCPTGHEEAPSPRQRQGGLNNRRSANSGQSLRGEK